ALLRSLSADDWQCRTLAPKWNVKEVAAHLLDTQLRKLFLVRDGQTIAAPEIRSAADLAAFINGLNAEGVKLYSRLGTAQLIDRLESSGAESATFHASLDPFAPAKFGVSWAGEMTSLNWFDTARELTERWHHQQQIRVAVCAPPPGIMTPE